MTKKGRKESRLFARNEAIYKAYVCGAALRTVGEEFNLSHVRIAEIVAETRERLQAPTRDRIEQMKTEQQLQLKDVYDKAARSYAKSTKVSREASDAKGQGRVEQTTKGQAGDPAFLRVMCQALADIRKIWGMDAPIRTENKHEHSGQVRITERVVTKRQAVVDAFNENGSNGNRS